MHNICNTSRRCHTGGGATYVTYWRMNTIMPMKGAKHNVVHVFWNYIGFGEIILIPIILDCKWLHRLERSVLKHTRQYIPARGAEGAQPAQFVGECHVERPPVAADCEPQVVAHQRKVHPRRRTAAHVCHHIRSVHGVICKTVTHTERSVNIAVLGQLLYLSRALVTWSVQREIWSCGHTLHTCNLIYYKQ